MSVLLVRHALSEANNRHNRGSLAFAAETAPLMQQGREQAARLGLKLQLEHIVDLSDAVAVSELRRSQQTAEVAGFTNQVIYPTLNEVTHGMPLEDLRRTLDAGRLPVTAITHAQNLLENPPDEGIWVTHGLVIAGLCAVLGVHQDKRLVPEFCEIREIDL